MPFAIRDLSTKFVCYLSWLLETEGIKPSDWHLHEPMVSTLQAEIFTFMHSVTILMFLCHELQQAVLTQSNYVAHKPRNKGQRGCKAVKQLGDNLPGL